MSRRAASLVVLLAAAATIVAGFTALPSTFPRWHNQERLGGGRRCAAGPTGDQGNAGQVRARESVSSIRVLVVFLTTAMLGALPLTGRSQSVDT